MAPAHAPLASLSLPDVALAYSSPTACAALPTASESELLPAATPGARVRVERTAGAHGDGCGLFVTLSARDASEHLDVFEAAAALDANVAALKETASLRGAAGLRELVLERVTLQVATKRYDVLLRDGGGVEPQPASSLVLYGAKCSPQLRDAALVLHRVVPSGVDAGKLSIDTSDDVAVAGGHALDCAAVLEVAARAPLLRLGAMDDVLSYVRTLNANLDETFEVDAHKRMVASVELRGAVPSPSLLEAMSAPAAVAVDATASSFSSYNAPTKQMTMGILAGLVGLVALLVAVATTKRRHEKQCEERYRNASTAAQIRRVSLRMASPRRSRDAFGLEDEEEKEYEAYGEDDGLL
ncbi:hypothetical protein PybrP1_007652 [[Pythium] brassicae (nom. inval.)]|nr:hypothetical protein PybrP1_007652 [[Pythium] brassicae (nom. inval.)]